MTEINDFLDAVIDQDFSKAGPMFNDLLDMKLNDALEQEKIAVADQIFNGAEVDEDEIDDDISDEDLDAMLDEIDDDVFDEEEDD